MKILIATGQPFIPQMYGGLQSSGHTLALKLSQRGHEVSVLAALKPEGYWGIRGRLIMKLLKWKAAPDKKLGYTTWRAWFPWESLEFVSKRTKLDVIIVLARQPVRMALEAQRLNIPVLMNLQDVVFTDHGGDFSVLSDVPCVANSQFTAEKYSKAFGVKPVIIHPLMEPEAYRTATTRENVTFINPQPSKGVDIALNIARECPEIPFVFCEGWPLESDARQKLEAQIAPLPNVTLVPNTGNMSEIYGKSKIVLTPSRWEEAFGRVACEPQFSGIPVVSSNVGGLPEAVGKGGMLVDPNAPIGDWVNAVKKLWSDDTFYKSKSAAAIQHMNEADLNIESLTSYWEKVIQEVIDAHSDNPAEPARKLEETP
ncbi:MAG: glycosyltransferase [Rickettsiales bacterium]